MQHYHKVIFTEDPEPDPTPESVPELEPNRNDSDIEDIELPCGKFAIRLKLLVIIILHVINYKHYIDLTIKFYKYHGSCIKHNIQLILIIFELPRRFQYIYYIDYSWP